MCVCLRKVQDLNPKPKTQKPKILNSEPVWNQGSGRSSLILRASSPQTFLHAPFLLESAHACCGAPTAKKPLCGRRHVGCAQEGNKQDRIHYPPTPREQPYKRYCSHQHTDRMPPCTQRQGSRRGGLSGALSVFSDNALTRIGNLSQRAYFPDSVPSS